MQLPRWMRGAAVVVALILSSVPGSIATASGSAWVYTANDLAVPRYSFRATTLLDGRVLIEGGFAPGVYETEAELFDPQTNTWTPTGRMSVGRGEHSATRLLDGRVLVAGGYPGAGNSAEIYDPATGTWSPTGSPGFLDLHSAVLLADGRVLAVGGYGFTAAQLYDPATGQWSPTGSMNRGRFGPYMALLADGRVLVAGGGNYGPGEDTTEYYDPATGTFSFGPSLPHHRGGVGGALLDDGRVLVIGGIGDPESGHTADVIDPVANTSTATGPMTRGHYFGLGEDAQTLPDGRVIAAAGSYVAGDFVTDIYDPAANTWTAGPPLHEDRVGSSTALLNDGSVLVVSGIARTSGYTLTRTAELLRHDTTPPAVAGTPDRSANAAGWYNAPVAIDWLSTDPAPSSGTPSDPPDTLAATEGANVVYASDPSCDPAGNCATGSLALSIDSTAPMTSTPSFSTGPKSISSDSVVSTTVADALSGVVGGEYFIDSDPGRGNGVPMSLSGGVLSASLGTNLATGLYTIGVRSEDAAGNWSALASAILVVYDPAAGFATGGGWLVPGSMTSDAGDALPGLDGTSKANFGFVVKYQNGAATVPGGHLTFNYNVGGFHLASSDLEWLVVTNDNWAKFEGTATINGGAALYRFRVDARDGNAGQSDRFGIRIWAPGADPDTSGILYKASGDVSGGQVIIHH